MPFAEQMTMKLGILVGRRDGPKEGIFLIFHGGDALGSGIRVQQVHVSIRKVPSAGSGT
jgi:hypothetical protein